MGNGGRQNRMHFSLFYRVKIQNNGLFSKVMEINNKKKREKWILIIAAFYTPFICCSLIHQPNRIEKTKRNETKKFIIFIF